MMSIKESVEELIRCHYKYLSERNRDITEMRRETASIIAETKALKAAIEKERNYFQHNINERERLYKIVNNTLDKAIRKGDIEVAEIALMTLEIISSKNPFVNL